MSRSDARKNAFMFLYALEIQKESIADMRANFLRDFTMDTESQEYFDILVQGVEASKAELDQLIQPCLRNWSIQRLPVIDLCILRIAVFEMQNLASIPVSVSISEAVLLAKKYSSDEARSYINAVLSTLNKNKESVCLDSPLEN